jgi:hypothetical protein
MNDEPEVYSTDERIEAIFHAALDCGSVFGDRKLSDAIDAAMSHAYAEGRADQLRDMREAEFEKAARAMNETGQGEHGHLHPVFTDILNQIAPKRAA